MNTHNSYYQDNKKMIAQEQIRRNLAGEDTNLTPSVFLDYGVEGVLGNHMKRLIAELDSFESWFVSAHHKHVYNFFGFLDERQRNLKKKQQEEGLKRRALQKAEQSEESFKNLLIIANRNRVVLAKKRYQLVALDDYGVEVGIEKWAKEIEYFVDKVACIDRNLIVDQTELFRSIDNIAKNQLPLPDSFLSIPRSDGLQFELNCATTLESYGWIVLRTKTTGDQGVDLIASLDSVRVAIQCKDYFSPVGNKAVQEIYAGKKFENCDYGVVVTKSTYTESARQLADKLDIRLLHFSELKTFSSILF